MRGESRILSCCFCVWYMSRELGSRGGPIFSCITPGMESFSSFLLQAIISYWTESNLESYQTSMMEFFCENNGFNTLTVSAKKLHRMCSAGIWIWSSKIKFYKIISFGIISKITVNRRKIVRLYRNSTADTTRANFWDFDKFFMIVVFKVFSPTKTIFKVHIKSLILPKLISLWCLYYNIWTRFYLLYVLEESKVVARKSFFKKVLWKVPQNSQENICTRVSFAITL